MSPSSSLLVCGIDCIWVDLETNPLLGHHSECRPGTSDGPPKSIPMGCKARCMSTAAPLARRLLTLLRARLSGVQSGSG